jgi:hypothetical protein
MDWILDLLTVCIHHSELHFTVHWHTKTSVLSILQSPLAVSWKRFYRGRFFSFPRSGPLITAARAELFSTDNSTNGFQAGGHFTPTFSSSLHRLTFNWQLNSLTHQPATSRDFTQLNCWQLTVARLVSPLHNRGEGGGGAKETPPPTILLLLSSGCLATDWISLPRECV